MVRQVSTVFVLAMLLMLGGCNDEIVIDAIPVKDAASDRANEGGKEGGVDGADGARLDEAAKDDAGKDEAAKDGAAKEEDPAGDAGYDDSPAEADVAATDAFPE